MATSKKSKKKSKDLPEETILDDYGYEEMDPDIDLDAVASMIEDIDDLPIYLRVLFFGDSGTGKTTVAGTFPGPIVYVDCNEEGTFSVRGQGHKRIRVRRFETLESVYWYLKMGKHPYKTVVIDTVTQLADIGMQKVLNDDDYGGLPIKKHWGQNTHLMKLWLIMYRNLDMNVVFLCQLKRLDEEDIDSDISKTVIPLLSPAVGKVLQAAVDIIGYTFVKEEEVEVKGKKKKQFSYRMRIGPHSSILTKVRVKKGVKYPAVIKDPTYDKLFEILTKEV